MNDIFTIFKTTAVLFPIIILLIYYLFLFKIRYNVHSHWDILIDDFSFSTKEFYKLLRQEVHKKKIPKISFESVALREGNMFSSRRLYQRINWKNHHFDICAAPYGNGFFISWWMVYKLSVIEWIIMIIPYIGPWLHRKFFTLTYYKIDTALMFMKYVHLCVLEVFDELTITEGVRLLDDEERKPILNDIFNR